MLDQARFTHTPLTEKNDSSPMGGGLVHGSSIRIAATS
jgi:hypothetical protein